MEGGVLNGKKVNEMKRIFLAIIAIAALLVCSGCVSYEVFTAHFNGKSLSQNAFVISSFEELRGHIDKYDDYLFERSYYELRSYDEEYFKDNKLILLYHTEITSSNTIKVKDVRYSNGVADVILTRVEPDVKTHAMQDYVIIVEIPQEENCISAAYEFE